MRLNVLLFVMYCVRTGSTYRTLVARNCLQGLYPVLHTAVSEFATFLPPTGVDMLRGGQRVRDAHSLIAECADQTPRR